MFFFLIFNNFYTNVTDYDVILILLLHFMLVLLYYTNYFIGVCTATIVFSSTCL